uniref:3-dehydroquinate synthase domain-containing protein n=1 Tax=Fibrocapsa japonica TaxID=94617 RepID=A0A7S2V593_9STRA|mmetsp:Transcript_7840/g.11946  ORF Transcript_7840/g.11946 Transcript_7840/m.11946 type:complete len:432 (+) Transcript_7840:150-1445(+)|eukprot:CAMPEP_0113944466 /NCGR_PEP_ID=MMETSP1339-20121228/34437_1 /TAXON_ID=94617 /ORGANISM="Fibrocapsa japonica" /LENGTH=431 /DNA_ID=CAMNT_0000949681 /DNA_START=80 /DNA_END=1375 /DNA_ORIENTATION=+ /assembly_acc=CAM_ASM_000762
MPEITTPSSIMPEIHPRNSLSTFLPRALEQVVKSVTRSTPDEYDRDSEGLRKVDFRIGEETFPIFVGHDRLDALIAKLKLHLDTFDHLFLGYDENTVKYCAPQLEAALQRAGISFKTCVMGLTEANKNMAALDHILETFLQSGGTRKTVMCPVGGGIVSNTFGLAAGLLFRGIRLVQIPTTFLNAHDAVTSKKQAINHTGYKNIVGLFHLPSLVLCDTSFYETLTRREMKAGLGELTKNAALFGGDHYELMKRTTMDHGWQLTPEEMTEATFLGMSAKDMLLCQDPKEKHLALLFEYGHTVGHALELTQGVSTSHGEGVTLGMLAVSYIAWKMGIMTAEDREAHDALVHALDPEIIIPDRDCLAEVMDKVMHDNKRGYLPEREGFVPMILNKRIGEMHKPNPMYLEYCPVDLVEESVKVLLNRYGPYKYKL